MTKHILIWDEVGYQGQALHISVYALGKTARVRFDLRTKAAISSDLACHSHSALEPFRQELDKGVVQSRMNAACLDVEAMREEEVEESQQWTDK